MSKPPLLVRGMHGMGDNLHQRAVMRQLLEHHEVWLESSWFSIYHDLIGDGLHVMRKPTRLRTQAKNQDREAGKFDRHGPPQGIPSVTLQYSGHNVRRQPSQTILSAMCESAGMGVNYALADYRLPIPQEWTDKARELLHSLQIGDRPLMIYRPLVERPEWVGSVIRNADPMGYAQLLHPYRDQFFILSIADLVPGREWAIGPVVKADAAFHSGEIPFETLAALFQEADMAYTSSGFAAILAPATETPVISVTGGFERAIWHESGAKFAPYLGIESATPCDCATSACRRGCNKALDLPREHERMAQFLKPLGIIPDPEPRPFEELFTSSPKVQPPSPVLQRRGMRA